jgi:phosphoribosylanthranilate isomerase
VLKVCGATTPDDVELLAEAGAELVGLWHGIPGGPAELPARSFCALAAAAHRTGRAEPVLVTFLKDPAALAGAVARSGVRWVQLHAYQPPAVVRALKAAHPDVTVVKVLHVQGGACVERRFVGAYERAGTDLFLLDATTGDGRVGSTGERLDPWAVSALADSLSVPFLLAGGITDVAGPGDGVVASHPRFLGVDVDTGARLPDGRFDARRVAAIRSRWWTPVDAGQVVGRIGRVGRVGHLGGAGHVDEVVA